MDPIDPKHSAEASAPLDSSSPARESAGFDAASGAPKSALSASARDDDSLLSQLRRGTIVDGKYRIDRRLGRGSMGIVVAATHLHLDERVALKFLHARINAAPDDFHARFQREAQISAKLRGEHVARVIDIGLWQDRYPFMVLDHLTGVDLRSTLKAWGGTLSVDLATEYVVQICEGMAEAHALGIVHCDLKPSNIFVTKRADGSDLIKILDFGISRKSTPEDQNEDATLTSVVLGSPKYMAPERLFGSSTVDPRADIWSIGAIYYELLVGRPPFDFSTLRQLYDAHRADYEPPSIRERNPWVTPALEAAVMRCFLRERERRMANVAELSGSILDAIGEPYASDVQTRLLAVLAGPAERDLQASSLEVLTASAPAQRSPGIRSAHTEDHAARRLASSIPPPLPSTRSSRPLAQTALLATRRHLVAVACVGLLLGGGALAWLVSSLANRPAAFHMRASQQAGAPLHATGTVVAPRAALDASRNVLKPVSSPLAPAPTTSSPSARAALRAPLRAREPLHGEAAPSVEAVAAPRAVGVSARREPSHARMALPGRRELPAASAPAAVELPQEAATPRRSPLEDRQ